ncbi:MAG: hypothetical protein ISF22_08390 [Methanomassiliicoccus sp.]|nr:hypothetical protein [Methanomassiliicoccus sp.]
MRWSLLGVRLAIVAVNLAIVAIIVLSVLPLVNGQLTVDIPEDVGEPVMEGDIMTMSVPVEIYNGGYFDIKDLQLHLRVSEGGRLLMEDFSEPVDVMAGKVNKLDLSLELDINDVPEEVFRTLAFNSTTLDLEVGIDAGYSLGLVKASVSTFQEMEWEPLVSDLALSTTGIQAVDNGTNVDILVPLFFQTSEFARGKTVDIGAQLSNSTAVITTTSERVSIGNVQGPVLVELRFVMTQEAFLSLQANQEPLDLGVDLTLMGATVHVDRVIDLGGMT